MSLKWKEISVLVKESREILLGSIIQKIFQVEGLANQQSVIFQGFHPHIGTWRVWISLMKENAYWALLPQSFQIKATPKPSDFIMTLRKFLIGKKIDAISSIEGERIFLILFENYVLDVELIPKAPNVVLLKEWGAEEKRGIYVSSFHRVSLEKGGKYALPPLPKNTFDATVDSVFEQFKGLDLHFHVAQQFFDSVGESDFTRLKRLYKANAKGYLKKIQSALKNAEAEYKNSLTAQEHLRNGKILSANLYKLGNDNFPKSNFIIIDSMKIPLNKALSYSENAQSIFKKAKKLGKASETSEERMLEIQKKVSEIENLNLMIEKAQSMDDILGQDNLFKNYGIEIPSLVVDKKDSTNELKEYLIFRSSDGFTIYCGRNQEENRKVTFRLAKGNDLWMHVRGVPGSHVVVKSEKGKTFPLSTLLEAAQICVFYSKVKRDKKVEVDYTLKKYVRSIKGTLAEVSYTENKTLLVNVEPNFMRNLKMNI